MHGERVIAWRVFWLPILLSALCFAGCTLPEDRAESTRKPDILFVSVDTLRSDHLGCYGYQRPVSPTLDALALGGTVFDEVISTSSWTLPAHASMLTGRLPAFHGLQDDGTSLPGNVSTLAERLSDAGYRTVAVVSHVYVSSLFGLDRGFSRFDDSLTRGGTANPRATEVADRALALIDEEPARPWFLFVHFFDPHTDYDPPAPFGARFTDQEYRGPVDGTLDSLKPLMDPSTAVDPADLQQAVDLYDGEIAYTDEQIGRLLDGLDQRGLLRGTVVIITSDHGEEFREHGRMGHGHALFEEQLRVPLIIAGHPGFPAATRRDDPVSLTDLAPTIIDLAGAEPLDRAHGSTLLGGPLPRQRLLVSESIRFGNEMRAARIGPHKLIHLAQGDVRWFFDFQADPGEQRPLAGDPSGGRLGEALARYAAEADAGWHLKFLSLGPEPMHCRGTVRLEAGRLVSPRRYYSGYLDYGEQVSFPVFEPAPDGRSLRFEVEVRGLIAEVSFTAAPADAPVLIDVVFDGPEGAGLFLGPGGMEAGRSPLRLLPDDACLSGVPSDYREARPGCYVRYVKPPPLPGESVVLSPESRAHLEALGYLEQDEGGRERP